MNSMPESFYDLLIGGAIMAEFLNPKDWQTAKDIKEAIEKIKKLNKQKERYLPPFQILYLRFART